MPLPLAAIGAAKVGHRVYKAIRGKSLSARHKGAGTPHKRRSRAMHMRKGRLFLGFTSKEVKAALRSRFGGRRGRK